MQRQFYILLCHTVIVVWLPHYVLAQSGRIYWVDTDAGHIARANIDGSHPETIIQVDNPHGLFVNSEYIYWTTAFGPDIAHKIQRSDLEGNNVTTLVDSLWGPKDIVVIDGLLYWINSGTTADYLDGTIGATDSIFVLCVNKDGTNMQTLVRETGDPRGITVTDDHIYWTATSPGNKRIQRSDRDGTNIATLVQGLGTPIEIVVTESHIYWTDVKDGFDNVGRANLDGSNQITLIDGEMGPQGLSLGATHLFWTDGGRVRRSNLDGTGIVSLIEGQGNLRNIQVIDRLDALKIVFRSERDGDREIYVMHPDGSGQTRLTNRPGDDNMPAWSPYGTKIAWRGDGFSSGEIFVMNADGSNITQLTDNTAEDNHPRWSPDGNQIVFNSDRDRGGGNGDIYLMTSDGTGQTRLTFESGDHGSPDWSPDGTRIVFHSSRTGTSFIYTMNPDGSNVTQVTDISSQHPAWSPDGSRIIYEALPGNDYEIFAVDPDGANPVNLTNSPGVNTEPTWSPDGSLIAFNSNRDGDSEIYIMDSDGSNVIQLTDNTAADQWPYWVYDVEAFRGDITWDTDINILDIIVLVRMIVGLDPVPSQGTTEFAAADLVRDGQLNVADVIGLVNTILGVPLIKTVPSEHVAVAHAETHMIYQRGYPTIRINIGTTEAAGMQAELTLDRSTGRLGKPYATTGRLESHISDSILRFVVYSETSETIGPFVYLPILSGHPDFFISDLILVNRSAQYIPVVIRTAVTSGLPESFALHEATPNPFNPTTTIAYEVPEQSQVAITIYNMLGQEVVRLVDHQHAPGRYNVTWDGRNTSGIPLASGIYVYRLESSTGFSEAKRMILVK